MKKVEMLRFAVVLCGICVLYLALVVKLFYWQVVKAADFSELGRAQSSETLEVPAIRGEIRSSDNFPLATNTISYTLISNPKVIEEKELYAQKLAQVLSLDSASVSAQLARDLFWVKLASNVSLATKTRIENLQLKGMTFEQEYSRFYPEASMAAHLIGFLGRNQKGEPSGYFGVEGEYNDQLAGRSGALYAIKDALGNQILGDIREDQKIDGRNVKLTIDRSIQFLADQKLAEGIKKYDAEGGNIIIIEPATGAILAMSSFPRFDPKKYYEYDPATYRNPALSSLYEPGSTFKVLVMGAAIDAGLVKPDTKCDICTGPIQIGEYQIKTWNDKYFPRSSMTDVIVRSDNTGMVYVGKKLGLDRMASYFEKFGLGEPTGIDLQGEASGVIRDRSLWYPIDLATSSFGQGISLTPMQLIVAVNSIAAGGNLMRPYIVSEITTDEGKRIEIKPQIRRKTISDAAAKQVTAMMVAAVEQGEAKWVKIKNYRVAGKTGTAQIPVEGYYDPNQTVASFVGFFPAERPRITMLVTLHRPKTSIYGSETAAPVFFNVAREIIKYYNLPSQ